MGRMIFAIPVLPSKSVAAHLRCGISGLLSLLVMILVDRLCGSGSPSPTL
jgi:flagellar biosynthesis protein FliR